MVWEQVTLNVSDANWASEIINGIHGLVISDRCLKVFEIASAVYISRERVLNNLYQHLNIKNEMVASFTQSWSKKKDRVPRTIFSCFRGIHRTFVIISSLRAKHWHNTIRLRSRNNPNNGFQAMNLHQKRQRPFP